MDNGVHYPLYDWKEIADKFKHMLVLGNGASIAISQSFNYTSLFQSAVEANFITGEINQLFEHFGTNNFEYVLRLVANAHDVNMALKVEEVETEKAYLIIRDALINIVQKVHVAYDQVELALPNIANFLEGFDTIVSLNYDLILYWAILWANDHGIIKYFKDCFINDGEFESDWTWLRKPYHGRDSTLVFYPHGNLVLATDIFGDTKKIMRDGRFIEFDGELYKVADSDLMEAIVRAWKAENHVPLFVSEGDNKEKQRAIQRNGYLNTVYETVLSDQHETLAIYGWSIGEADDHILSKLISGEPKKIAISIYKQDDWEDTASVMIQRILKHYRQKHIEAPEIFFYNSASEGCWNN